MAVRWILTVIAIIIFSWLMAKMVKKEDIQETRNDDTGLSINSNACMGCSLCAKNYPEVFEMQGNKAHAKELVDTLDAEKLANVIQGCPTKAITYNGVNTVLLDSVHDAT